MFARGSTRALQGGWFARGCLVYYSCVQPGLYGQGSQSLRPKLSIPPHPECSEVKCVVTATLKVQVPNSHILSKIVTYVTTIPNPSI